MATLRELRDRIRSVSSTKQITKAQEMIATSRITKAQQRVEAAAPYADELLRVVERLARESTLDNDMLRQREDAKVAAVLVVTSDRGMCGGYNNSVLKKAAALSKLLRDKGYEVDYYVAGDKGINYYRFRDIPVVATWSGFSQEPTWESTSGLIGHLVRGFQAGSEETVTHPNDKSAEVRGFDQLHVVYTEFVSMLEQKPRVQQVLPLEPVFDDDDDIDAGLKTADEDSDGASANYEFEPDVQTLLDELLPKYVARSLFSMFLEASAAESASRRTAMKNATDNASELVEDLGREANQARQAQITQEISEIVGGAGALAGSGESD